MFDLFKRVNKRSVKGTGLGFAIAKRTTELHSGNIGVEGNPSARGSIFWATVKKV